MDIQERLAETKRKYDEAQAQRNGLVEQANALLTEMNKLEGEWRLLQEMTPDGPALDPNSITAEPEPDKPNEEE